MNSLLSRVTVIARRMLWLTQGARRPQCGEGSRIHPTARFEGEISGISIGRNVVIEEFAKLHCQKGGQIEIGDGSYIGEYAIIHTGKKGGSIKIGQGSGVQSFSIIYGHGGCLIGDNVRIAAHCVIIPANHQFANTSEPIRSQGLSQKGITIEDDVWLGAGVKVMDGVTIGRQTVVGAGAVVTRALPPGSVATGVPARIRYSRYEK